DDANAGAPCEAGTRSEFRCRSARGGLDEVRRLNRPAVLEMRDAQGRVFFACLTALDSESATFTFGETTRRVALAALASQWTGNYTAMWRMPAEVPFIIRPGDRGPSVQWLRAQLARIDGTVAPSLHDAVFDQDAVREVKQFQLAHGLVPDGTVGIQTLMHLASAADNAAPTLMREPGEQ
ncbi:MAG TPA: peptidoglycan-binding protein, partial [Burkholderiales bacterium]|nr:peptidoglycan-binding protein [Burkholderiales bacterium]